MEITIKNNNNNKIFNRLNYKEKLSYFTSNEIIEHQEEKSIKDYYYNLPFKLFSLLFHSFTEESVQITNFLSVPQKLWNQYYFDNATIKNISQKKNIFILYNYKIEIFLQEFKRQRKITSKIIENLSKEMNEIFVNKALNSNNSSYLKVNKEMKKDIENLKSKSYMDIIRYLIQNAMRMNEVLKISNLNNYDYIEDIIEKEENEIIQNSRIKLSQFFSNIILKIILNDLHNVLLFYIKNENEKSYIIENY
jgi:hypothetical protein